MTDKLIGTRLGQYELIELIRRGGMATVYKAHQASLDRFVAVKVLFHNRDPQFALRFKREARAIAQLQHPNILPIYDYGEQDGLLFLALQLVENGATLTDLIATAVQPMELVPALKLTRRLLAALEYAHRRGIVHRDIKPANVLMPEPDWPMLADFGIAKLLNDNSLQLTTPGLAVGTAAYMAPEQALAQDVDTRTDLYSIGVVLYELLTGRAPFDAEQPLAVLTKHVYEPPLPLTRIRPEIPLYVEQTVLRALEKRPDDRYQTAGEMSKALDEAAVQLQREDRRGQLTGLYQAGVLAFAEGRWDQAVEQLSKLVKIDPEYEDSADLLSAAEESRERARAEARTQFERVRQRRSTVSQDGVGAQPNRQAEAVVGETTRLPAPPTIGAATNLSPSSSAQTGNTARMPPSIAGETDRLAEGPPTLTPRETDPNNVVQPAPPAGATDHLARVSSEAQEAARIAAIGAELPAPQLVKETPATAVATPGARPGRRGLVVGIGVVAALLVAVTAALATGLWPGRQIASVSPTEPAINVTSAPAIAQATVVGPTAAPTASGEMSAPAALSAPRGTIVVEEDFSAGGERTGLVDRDDDLQFSRGFHPPGVYHFRLAQPNETRVVLLPRRLYHDFTIQLEAWDNSDDFVGTVAQGVVFRAQDADHYYALLLDPRSGRYMVRKADGSDRLTDLIAWKESALVKRNAEHNNIRIDAGGGTFTIYLNEQLLDSFSDSEYPSGMLGLIVNNGDATRPHMHFDNLKIWNVDFAMPDPGLAPTRDTPSGPMVLIQGGLFVMGDNERNDAAPHLVELPSYYIDQTEVTNAEYAACIAAGTCTDQHSPASYTHPNYATQPEYADFPVLHVSWEQANQYCQWAGKRLPSEAEWEKAASWSLDGRKLVWPLGDAFDSQLLNAEETRNGDTTAVGKYPAELNGSYDMAGNVSEWTGTLYKPYPYDVSDGREDPQVAGDRVFRGGSWAQTQGKARSALRQFAAPTYFDREIGFRCAVMP